jgi:hypothetical protein
MMCSALLHGKQDGSSLMGIITFGEVVIECLPLIGRSDLRVVESKSLAEYPSAGNVMAPIFGPMTSVGDDRCQLLNVTGVCVKCILGHINRDQKCNGTIVFLGMVTFPRLAAKVYEQKSSKTKDKNVIAFLVIDNLPEQYRILSGGIDSELNHVWIGEMKSIAYHFNLRQT